MNKKFPAVLGAVAAAVTLSACDSSSNSVASHDEPAAKPNILFVIMDDVGIDQMASFGYGGSTPPRMPNITTVAEAGLRFHNTWAMPECSPSRAAFFAGRYPMRTNILQAIGPNDLAVSHVSPYESTAPKILKKANYESAMFGKFHLGGPENNEAGNGTPAVLGWDYFYGWVGGLPGSVDTSAGGAAPDGTHSCGFVPSTPAGGADAGACYQPDLSCKQLRRDGLLQDPVGLQCLESGGIFVPHQTCGTPPSTLDFTRLNGYYVSPLVIIEDGHVEEVPLTDSRARGYRTTIETDAAIEWIKTRPQNRPWMATVSYSSAHTPWQPPPGDLIPGPDGSVIDGLNCIASVPGRIIQNRMIEALDTEFGRLLVETGMARRGEDGSLIYDPAASNTVIVIVGDNGSLAAAVKQPFDPSRAKGSTYQTGVWAPLIVAGPQVVEPGRTVDHMLNMVDLFEFFGEVAGIDVHQEVPRTVDSVSVLPYLTNPEQAGLRTTNFAVSGLNYQANGARNGPCVISTACTVIPTSKSVCEDNQGEWWGPGYEEDSNVVPNGGVGYLTCSEVNQVRYKNGMDLLNIVPESSVAVRDERYKLVRNTSVVYVPETDGFRTDRTEELFEINQAVPVPLLDTAERNLLVPPISPELQRIRDELAGKMEEILASEVDCPGDGNIDGVVDGKDMEEWGRIAHAWGGSSVYDFKVNGVYDGLTNTIDAGVIQSNLGKRCGRVNGGVNGVQ